MIANLENSEITFGIMGAMKTKTISQTKVGDTYERNRFEVHCFNERSGDWYCLIRSAQTLSEARAKLRERKEWDQGIKYIVNFGRFPKTRIVEVKATCTVVE